MDSLALKTSEEVLLIRASLAKETGAEIVFVAVCCTFACPGDDLLGNARRDGSLSPESPGSAGVALVANYSRVDSACQRFIGGSARLGSDALKSGASANDGNDSGQGYDGVDA